MFLNHDLASRYGWSWADYFAVPFSKLLFKPHFRNTVHIFQACIFYTLLIILTFYTFNISPLVSCIYPHYKTWTMQSWSSEEYKNLAGLCISLSVMIDRNLTGMLSSCSESSSINMKIISVAAYSGLEINNKSSIFKCSIFLLSCIWTCFSPPLVILLPSLSRGSPPPPNVSHSMARPSRRTGWLVLLPISHSHFSLGLKKIIKFI